MRHDTTGQPSSFVTFLHIFTVFAIALGIRTFLWLKFPHVIFLHEADGIGYISIARNIVENFSISNATHFPPMYPALIALFSMCTGSYESGARFASMAMGAGMVIPFYLAARFLMPARAALCAALLAACFGPFVDYSLQPISQATYVGLIAIAVWIGLRSIKEPTVISLVLFGTTSAAIYLTRPEGILFFAINIPILAYAIYSAQTKNVQRLRLGGILFFSFFLPVTWYIVCLKRFTGTWSISGKSGVTTIGVDASMKIMTGGKTLGEISAGKAGLADMIPSFTGFISTYLTQLGKFWTVASSSFPVMMFIFALLGISVLVHELFNNKPDRILYLGLCWMFLSPLVMLLPVMAFDKISVSSGYVLPFFMVLLCFCAKGIAWLESLLKEQFEKMIPLPPGVSTVIPLAILTSLLFSWQMCMPLYQWLSSEEFNFMATQQDFLLRTTGRWFKNNTEKSSKLMARWSNIGYYGERSWVGLADGSIKEVADYARMHDVTHIVIDSDAVPRRRPQLAALLNPSETHPGLTPVYASEQTGTRVIIYRIN